MNKDDRNKKIKILIISLIFFNLVMYVFTGLLTQTTNNNVVSYNEFLVKVSSKEVSSVNINFSKSTFIFEDKDGKKYKTDNPKTVGFKSFLLDNNIEVKEETGSSGDKLELAVKVLLNIALIYIMFTMINPNKFTNESFLEEVANKNKISFDDIAGCEEVKKDLKLTVDFLKNPKKYTDLGARLPKGIIFYGPPGTGKTLLAKAVAGEAGVPFFSLSGSDFVEMYVGLGAKRVKKLFENARKKAPCIIFIDEIDSLAKKRNKDSNSEADQTLNAMLKEMDGFSQREGIVVIGATNRLEELDKAFIRPGRFDSHLAIPLPELKDRLKMFKIHSKNKKLAEDVDLNEWAKITMGFSGASIESLLNESILNSIKNNRNYITNEDIDDAFYKTVMRGTKKDKHENLKQRELVAWHESGHALLSKLLTDYSIPKVTITPSSSGAGGVTFRVPKKEGLYSKLDLINNVKVDFGGRIAERILLGNDDDITIGASQDIKDASNTLKEYICYYGLSDEIGMINTDIIKIDDKRIFDISKKLAETYYKEAETLLNKKYDLLKEIAEALIERETLNEDDLDSIIKKYEKN